MNIFFMNNFILNLCIFFKELYENFKENKIFEKATSLSYITFVGFFPAFAGFLHIYSLIFKDYEAQVEKFFKEWFFLSSGQLKGVVIEFLEQTKAIGNIAIIFSFLIAIKLLFSIEKAINSIWSLEKRRPFIQKISSFTLILFWGPILYGLLNTYYYFLIKSKNFPQALKFLLPKLIFFFLFAVIIKIIPMASVSFSSAFLGSFFTSIFLYFLKYAFFAYFKIFKSINVFTGSIGLALLFIIIVNLFWIAILSGILISYVKENFEALKLKLHFKNIPLEDFQIFFSLKILHFLYENFKEGKELPDKGQISLNLLIEPKRLDFLIEKLKQGGFIIEDEKGKIGFAKDLSRVDFKEIVLLFIEDSLKIPQFIKEQEKMPVENYLVQFKEFLVSNTPSLKFEDAVGIKK